MTASESTAVVPEDNPPETRLGFEPGVESLDDVAVALHEIAWLESRLLTERAKIDEAIRMLKDSAEKRQVIEVDGEATTLTQRQSQLADAITAFITAHPETITETGKKTRKFTHGEVSLRSSKLSVALRAGKAWKDVLEKLKEVGWRRFIVTRQDVDKRRIIDELGNERIGDEDLKQIDLKRVPPSDEVKIKPAEYSLETPAAL